MRAHTFYTFKYVVLICLIMTALKPTVKRESDPRHVDVHAGNSGRSFFNVSLHRMPKY
jgi:hypothetical protein